MKTIFIRTGSGKSELRIGENWQNVRKLIPTENLVIITDEHINKLYGHSFPDTPVIVIPTGEKSKNFRLVEKITKKILQLKIDRHGFILGIGGGVVCDITGFVASIYLRGIDFGFISTSLLSQVDASVGGKNGINLGGAKNIIGNITQPKFVICDPVMLKTLPDDEYLSGLAELIKHALIKDRSLLNLIKRNSKKILSRDKAVMEKLVWKSVKIKSAIVTEDERESSIRRVLNFGHTFGHAIEVRYGFKHGISIAVGMVMASEFSFKKGMITKGDLEKVISLLSVFSLLPTSVISGRTIEKMLIHDKKRVGDIIHFVLLKSIGNAVILPVKMDELSEFLKNWERLLMKAIIKWSEIKGEIVAPSSKSAMQRAVAASLLAHGRSHLSNISTSDDSVASVKIAEALGATIITAGKDIYVTGGFNPRNNFLDCGEAGLSARLFTPLAALHDKEILITGRGSLLRRPVGMMESTLNELGVSIKTQNGFLPIRVKGPLKGGNASVDGSVSSQFLSGLLMALPVTANNSVLHVKDLKSKPYIDLTIGILKEFGIEVNNEEYKTFYINGKQEFKHTDYKVEGDWSGAAFLLVLGALSGEVTVTGLHPGSVQADRLIIDALKKAGVELETYNDEIKVKRSDLKCFEFNVSECPDLAPPLVALASRCEGTTVLSGTERLGSKESDRGQALEQEFNKLGVKVINRSTSIEITGAKTLVKAGVSSHNDHRIAMALAVTASTSIEEINIENAECVKKSYPDFFKDCQNLGCNIKLINN